MAHILVSEGDTEALAVSGWQEGLKEDNGDRGPRDGSVFGVLVVLPEGPLTAASPSSSGELIPSSWIPQAPGTQMAHGHTCSQSTHIYIK